MTNSQEYLETEGNTLQHHQISMLYGRHPKLNLKFNRLGKGYAIYSAEKRLRIDPEAIRDIQGLGVIQDRLNLRLGNIEHVYRLIDISTMHSDEYDLFEIALQARLERTNYAMDNFAQILENMLHLKLQQAQAKPSQAQRNHWEELPRRINLSNTLHKSHLRKIIQLHDIRPEEKNKPHLLELTIEHDTLTNFVLWGEKDAVPIHFKDNFTSLRDVQWLDSTNGSLTTSSIVTKGVIHDCKTSWSTDRDTYYQHPEKHGTNITRSLRNDPKHSTLVNALSNILETPSTYVKTYTSEDAGTSASIKRVHLIIHPNKVMF